jgi:hypothetical protein
MLKKLKKILKGEYNRLKRGMEKVFKPESERQMPQPALQPIRPRKYYN